MAIGDENKFDGEKVRLDLVEPSLIEAIGKVRTYGVKKYTDEQSWRKVEKPRYIAAAMRHFEAYRKGEINDTESGMPHLWHCACNLMFLIELEKEQQIKQTFSDEFELDNEVKCKHCKYHSEKTQHCIRKAEVTDDNYTCGMGVLRK